MKRILIIAIILGFCYTSRAQETDKFIINVTKNYIAHIDSFIIKHKKELLSRIIFDFNNDGLNDMLISGYYTGGWGNSGGNWILYYQKENGSFKKCGGNIFMHPAAAYFDKNKSKIITYGRVGCCEGTLIFTSISDCNKIVSDKIKLKAENGDGISQKMDSILKKIEGLQTFKVENITVENYNNSEWK